MALPKFKGELLSPGYKYLEDQVALDQRHCETCEKKFIINILLPDEQYDIQQHSYMPFVMYLKTELLLSVHKGTKIFFYTYKLLSNLNHTVELLTKLVLIKNLALNTTFTLTKQVKFPNFTCFSKQNCPLISYMMYERAVFNGFYPYKYLLQCGLFIMFIFLQVQM